MSMAVKTTKTVSFAFLLMVLLATQVFGQYELNENFQGFPSHTGYTDFSHNTWELTRVIASPGGAANGSGSQGLIQFRESQNSIIITPEVGSIGEISVNARASTTAGVNLRIEKFTGEDYELLDLIPITHTVAQNQTLEVNHAQPTHLRITAEGNPVIYLHDFSVTIYETGNTPPSIGDIIQTPSSNIHPEDEVWISAEVTPGDYPIQGVWLLWGTSGESLNKSIPMHPEEEPLHLAESSIPPQQNNTTVHYRINAEDEQGNSVFSSVRSYLVQEEASNPAIIEVETLQPLEVETGVPFSELTLPADLLVTLDNEQTTMLAVEWLEGDYNPEQEGSYFIYGNLILTGEVTNPQNLQAQIEVIVKAGETEEREIIAGWSFPEAGDTGADAGTISNLNKPIAREQAFTGNYSFPAGYTLQSISSSGWAEGTETKYWIVEISTLGYGKLQLSSRQRSSATGPRDFKVQYRVGEQGTWTDIDGASLVTEENFTSGFLDAIALPEQCNNKSRLFIRWTPSTNTSVSGNTVVAGGTSRIDAISISGVFSEDYKRTITALEPLPALEVEFGTPFDDLPLPPAVEVYFDDATSEKIPVIWHEGDYEALQEGSYLLYGDLQTGPEIDNPDNLTPVQEIVVAPEIKFFEVVFSVDMAAAPNFNPENDEVFITGSMLNNAIPGTLPDEQLMEQQEAFLFVRTMILEQGIYTYKYYINGGLENPEAGDYRKLELISDTITGDAWVVTHLPESHPGFMQIYPNPARDLLYVQSLHLPEEISLFHLSGKRVYHQKPTGQPVKIQLTELEAGIYLLRVKTIHGTQVRKINVSR